MKEKNVLIAGGSGLIGSALVSFLTQKGFEVSILSRSLKSKTVKTYLWDTDKKEMDLNALKGQDYIVNLAGAGIADKFWTKKRKDEILKSRLNASQLIAEGLNLSGHRPKLIVQASAIGYYGNRPNEILTEQSDAGTGFLSSVCAQWEKGTSNFSDLGIPNATLRIGVVLSNKGGYLKKMEKILRSRINICFGNGQQWVSWIHITDLLNMFLFLMESGKTGIYNAVSPHLVRSLELQKQIAHQRGWNVLSLKMPEKLVKVLLGDFSEVFLSNQHVIPQKLQNESFEFAYPSLVPALKSLGTP